MCRPASWNRSNPSSRMGIAACLFFVLSGFLVSRPFVRGRSPSGRTCSDAALDRAGVCHRGGRHRPDLGQRVSRRHRPKVPHLHAELRAGLVARGPLAMTWTLQLEVEFYLLLPLLMWAVHRHLAGPSRPGCGDLCSSWPQRPSCSTSTRSSALTPGWSRSAACPCRCCGRSCPAPCWRGPRPPTRWCTVVRTAIRGRIGDGPARLRLAGRAGDGASSVVESVALAAGTALLIGWLLRPGRAAAPRLRGPSYAMGWPGSGARCRIRSTCGTAHCSACCSRPGSPAGPRSPRASPSGRSSDHLVARHRASGDAQDRAD